MYELKYKPDLKKDSLVIKNYFLEIRGKESIFRSEYERTADSLRMTKGINIGRQPFLMFELSTRKNLQNNTIEKNITTPILGHHFFIEINENLNWKIGDKKEKIGELNCQNAEVEYGGRSWEAWFCPDIALNEGPYIFHGLPGLIIKIEDTKKDYQFSLLQLRNRDVQKFFTKKQGKEISWQQYSAMCRNFYADVFYEIKGSGLKLTTGDDKGNIVNVNPKIILNRHQTNFKKNVCNPIESDKINISDICN